jgi:DNA polymerase-4
MPPWILHIDFDAFFASVEQLRNPRLQGRPVAVGSGVIASCSYEARRFGLSAGMPLRRARRLCPDLIAIPGRGPIYRAVAHEAFRLCADLTPHLETYLDEANCDLTGTEQLHRGYVRAGRRIQEAIRRDLGLPVSIGLGSNRMIAKIAAKEVKPRGVGLVPPGDETVFIEAMPLEKLPGIGPRALHRLSALNLRSIGDLRCLTRESLMAMFGLPGHAFYERCRGRDTLPLLRSEIPRTISRRTSFSTPETDPETITGLLRYLTERAGQALRGLHLRCRTVTVQVEYPDNRNDTASTRLRDGSSDDDALFAAAVAAKDRAYGRRVALRRVGITLSRLVPETGLLQLSFDDLSPTGGSPRRYALMHTKDAIRNRWGHRAILSGRTLALRAKLKEDPHGFILRTSCLTQ